ncbi:hypothetical protein PP175_26935 (plasmid) [Aneurinibacillus sp. Ricciae_BoGa-3]|uniref:OmpL47-type beta-barrel domain-containing protein n=1 Tax=Aneurinibacillus sp. Ricciae_BoGa-3 TaxID=3022697 RepID=UPI0023410DD2|nr:hypothetical protein [Aneurinibacillus sp. Ricciae_BoGa-3]WCK57674.1 hypothetical protein PP175_26935 [Aneurinibacillus sp. Ricciae_BoGa-3]
MRKKIVKKLTTLLTLTCIVVGNLAILPVFHQDAYAYTAVTKTQTISFPSNSQQNRSQTLTIPNLKEVKSVTVDNGNVSYSVNGNQLTLNVSNGSGSTVQTGGSYSPADTKYVTGQTSAYYWDYQGYSGYLSSYLYSGSYTSYDSKYMTDTSISSSNNFSSTKYYNSGGYSGTLSANGNPSSTLISGSYTPLDIKYIMDTSYSSAKSFANTKVYNSGGYSGTLSANGSPTAILLSGSYTPADTKWVSGQTSTFYNAYGYTGNLSQYIESGSASNADTKYVTGQASAYYSDWQGYSGTLSSYVESGSYSQPTCQSITVTLHSMYADYFGREYYDGQMVANNVYWHYGRGFFYTQNGQETKLYQPPSELPFYDYGWRMWALYMYGDVCSPAVDSRVWKYQGYVTKPASDTRVYKYQGYVTRPASDTRVYSYSQNYSGYTVRPESDTRVYQYTESYGGTVVRPESDTRVYRYAGYVTKPAVDTRTWETRYSYRVTVQYTDPPNPPSINFNVPENQWLNKNVVVNLDNSGNIGIPGSHVEYSLTGAVNQGWTTYYSSFSISTDGVTTINARVVNNDGSISDVISKTVWIDKSNASLSLSASPLGWTNADVTITASAVDNLSGVKRIQLPNGSWVSGNSASYSVGANGTYTFVAEDNAGNQATKSITVSNIDSTPPTAPTISNNTNWTTQSFVPVSIVGGSDSQSGVNHTEYKLEGATNQGYVTYSQPFNVTNQGETKISARTIDNVGNASSEAISYVRIDRSTPSNTSITIQLKP